MKKIILVLLLFPLFINAQTSYELTNFSDSYFAKIIDTTNENSEVETNCLLKIYLKNNNKLIFSAPAFYSDADLEGSKIKSNIKQIPYGEQSILIFEDFNFDGTKDIALRTGYYSCYGGPSFAIYLATKNSFVYNESFTELGSNYCGMFTVDTEKKQLSTMTKSGCCWHQYSTYVVEKNQVIPIEIIEESYSGVFVDYSIKKRVNGKMTESTYKEFPTENKPEFTIIFENGKKMHLMSIYGNEHLGYVFTNAKNVVELFIDADFTYNKTNQTVSFKNGNTTYIVSEKGIVVKDGTKTHHLNKIKKITGAFNNIKWNKLSNVQLN
ncbi:hypothetical protein P3875_11470 [Myroides sp. JBRI-B21084]|uniref:XAC2610-related protein n=1 Tax=Myroides sp. JBRI-B21084 TaxID=3119977 RepID=UPI0026E3668E|nr:hypothetical protein [Paenimyroides cloacae]WKW46377.1 hypothetical protein P3875_11470 [Paenimyroides cloacae]